MKKNKEDEVSFSKELRRLKEERRMTLAEMSEVALTSCSTLDCWLYGYRTPAAERQEEVLERLRNAEPSEAFLKQHFRFHGLSWDRSKRRWKLRLTLDLGTKLIGKRVALWLKTSDPDVAVLNREAIVEGYRRLGLTVRERYQRRKMDPREMAEGD